MRRPGACISRDCSVAARLCLYVCIWLCVPLSVLVSAIGIHAPEYTVDYCNSTTSAGELLINVTLPVEYVCDNNFIII